MNQVEVLDNGVVFNGNLLTFPLSYEDIRALLGEARINVQSDDHFEYFYDELGISFEGATAYLRNLKKQKAYIDETHNITSMTMYVTCPLIKDLFHEFQEKNINNMTEYINSLDKKVKEYEK